MIGARGGALLNGFDPGSPPAPGRPPGDRGEGPGQMRLVGEAAILGDGGEALPAVLDQPERPARPDFEPVTARRDAVSASEAAADAFGGEAHLLGPAADREALL